MSTLEAGKIKFGLQPNPSSSVFFYTPHEPDQLSMTLDNSLPITKKMARKQLLSSERYKIGGIERPLSSIATCFTTPSLFLKLIFEQYCNDDTALDKIYNSLEEIERKFGLPDVKEEDGREILIRTSSEVDLGNPMFRYNMKSGIIEVWENNKYRQIEFKEMQEILTAKKISGIFLHVNRPTQQTNHVRIAYDITFTDTEKLFKLHRCLISTAETGNSSTYMVIAQPKPEHTNTDCIIPSIKTIEQTFSAHARGIDGGQVNHIDINKFINEHPAIGEIILALLNEGYLGGCVELRIYPNGHISVMDIDIGGATGIVTFEKSDTIS